MGALAILHGIAADQVSREMKFLAVELAIVQEARSQVNFKTGKIDGCCHPPEILTGQLQEKGVLVQAGAPPRP